MRKRTRTRGHPVSNYLPPEKLDGQIPIAIKSHLDGDPHPRADEIADWERMRVENGLDEIVSLILLPNDEQQEQPFRGYDAHGWRIHQRDGEVVCEKHEVTIEITDDDDGLRKEATFLVDGSLRKRIMEKR